MHFTLSSILKFDIFYKLLLHPTDTLYEYNHIPQLNYILQSEAYIPNCPSLALLSSSKLHTLYKYTEIALNHPCECVYYLASTCNQPYITPFHVDFQFLYATYQENRNVSSHHLFQNKQEQVMSYCDGWGCPAPLLIGINHTHLSVLLTIILPFMHVLPNQHP